MKLPRFFISSIFTLFFIIVLLPIFSMMVVPFFSEIPGSLASDCSLFDSRHLTLARNSLGLSVGTTALCLIIGVPLAFLLSRANLWGNGILRIISIIPILIPPYIHAIVWTNLNDFFKCIFHCDVHNLWGAMFVLTLAYFPFVALATQGGLRRIDRNMEEASLLYHGRWKTLTRITLPLVMPHIFSGAIFVFIFSLIDFCVPDILRVRVYPIEIFIQFSAFYNERAAALFSLPLIIIAILLIVLQRWYMKDRAYIQVSLGLAKEITYNLGWFNILACCFCFIILGLSAILPLVVLLNTAGSFSNYSMIFSTSIEQILYSFILAFLGAVLVMPLSFFVSYIIERAKTPTGTLFGFASFIPLAIPAITLGIGLIKVWNQPVVNIIYGSSFIVILGYIARFIPFSTIIGISSLKQINPCLEEAAFLSTARWIKVIRGIVVPLSQKSLVIGFFFVFILSFGELSTTLLIIPPGRETIPIKIYNLMHYGAHQMVAALCLILILIIFTFSGLFLLLYKKFTKNIR